MKKHTIALALALLFTLSGSAWAAVVAISAVVAGGCASRAGPPAANRPAAAPRLVAVKNMDFVSAGGTPFSARVWYPTSSGKLETFSANAVSPGYQAVRDGVPSLTSPIASAQHFSFLMLCGPKAREILAGTPEAFLCEDPEGRTREEIHAETLAAIAQFLVKRGVLVED
jgi:hypothetical protein